MPSPIRLEGLSEDDIVLLDIIYSCDDYETLMNWTHTLEKTIQLRVLTLIQIILHETIEEEMIKPMTSYPDAERMINQVRRKFK